MHMLVLRIGTDLWALSILLLDGNYEGFNPTDGIILLCKWFPPVRNLSVPPEKSRLGE